MRDSMHTQFAAIKTSYILGGGGVAFASAYAISQKNSGSIISQNKWNIFVEWVAKQKKIFIWNEY